MSVQFEDFSIQVKEALEDSALRFFGGSGKRNRICRQEKQPG